MRTTVAVGQRVTVEETNERGVSPALCCGVLLELERRPFLKFERQRARRANGSIVQFSPIRVMRNVARMPVKPCDARRSVTCVFKWGGSQNRHLWRVYAQGTTCDDGHFSATKKEL